MSIPPEPYLSALTKVLSQALIYCRAWSYSKTASPEHVADLMDAIHNIPEHITHWDSCDVQLLRASFLGVYEKKWRHHGGLALLEIFDAAVESYRAIAQQGIQADAASPRRLT